MKISVYAVAEVAYLCYLNEEDSRKVAKYAKDNNVSIEEAIEELDYRGAINLYRNCEEFSFTTKECYDSVTEEGEEDE